MYLDGAILLWIQENLRQDFLNPIVVFITSLGNAGIIWIVISLLLLIPKKTRKIGILSLLALLGSAIVNNLILKNLVGRVRPYEVVDGLRLIIERQKDASFPSGHSGSSFASAVVLYKNLPKTYGILALVLAALIALSRLYVGVHYPTDVLVGTIDGIIIGLVINKLGEHYGSV
ncbi:hypothetical protein P261_00376 [Lachnospiraceae bacterium TWA4]|nr:hypothetical protein P261_00376 [Lachnospiraceae bacterium TWA4]